MKRLQLLDYGRFIAAISVVAFHYLFNGIHNGKISSISHMPEIIDFAKYGYLGVEFFFMISGYVIFFSAKNRTSSEFAVSRAIRLYPAFWIAIIFTSIFAIFWGGESMVVYPSQILANFTMAAPLFGRNFVDGVYWTLIFELKFYLLVFILLFFGFRDKLEKIFLIWPFAIALATYFELDYLPYLGSYFCYFSAGVILAIMKENKIIFSYFSLLICFILCISFSSGKDPDLYASNGIIFSEYIIGFIVTSFFIIFIISNTKLGSNLNLYGSKLLGGLTYPIYLIHAHFGYMFISRFATEDNKIIIYILTVSIVLSVAFLIHTLIEKKYANFWKMFFKKIIGKPVDYINSKSLALASAYNNPNKLG